MNFWLEIGTRKNEEYFFLSEMCLYKKVHKKIKASVIVSSLLLFSSQKWVKWVRKKYLWYTFCKLCLCAGFHEWQYQDISLSLNNVQFYNYHGKFPSIITFFCLSSTNNKNNFLSFWSILYKIEYFSCEIHNSMLIIHDYLQSFW